MYEMFLPVTIIKNNCFLYDTVMFQMSGESKKAHGLCQ